MASSKLLLATLTPKMTELGYTFFKNSQINEIGMYCKLLDNGLCLSLVLIGSRSENNLFTADFYCSRHTGVYNLRDYFGNIVETRVGVITTGRDLWWEKESALSISSFAQSVEIAEKQFLKHIDTLYIKYVDQDIKEIYNLVTIERTIRIVNNNLINGNSTFAINQKINGISVEWFHAAEMALTEWWIKKNIPLFAIKKRLLPQPLEEITKGKVVKSVIVDFASDAYRLSVLKTNAN